MDYSQDKNILVLNNKNAKASYSVVRLASLFFMLFSHISHSKILKDEVLSIGDEEFSFSYVCKKMTRKDSPLIEVDNILTLDCMSRKIKVYRFCFKELEASPYYIRGIIDKERKKVVCKKGKKVSMKITCNSLKEGCKDSELACFNLQERYAARLGLVHHSSFKEGDEEVLNCHFSTKKKLTLPL